MSTVRERIREAGVYFGLADEQGREEPPPASLRQQALFAAIFGLVFALVTWAFDGGSAWSVVLRGVICGVIMFAFGWWGARRRAQRPADDSRAP